MENLRVCFWVSLLLLDMDSMPLSESSENARSSMGTRDVV